MPIISMGRLIGLDSRSQILPAQKPNPSPRYEKLKAVGYGTLGVIASLAIAALIAIATLFAAVLFFSIFGPYPGIEGAVIFLDKVFFTTVISSPFLAVYPIIKLAGPLFVKAQSHWNNI